MTTNSPITAWRFKETLIANGCIILPFRCFDAQTLHAVKNRKYNGV